MTDSTSKRSEQIARDLEETLPKERISASLFERVANALHPFPYDVEEGQVPYAVAYPETAEEVSGIMKYANREKVPVFVRGSGTQLGGSSRPHTHGIVLNVHRLNRFDIREDYGFFECGPGCVVGDLEHKLAAKGYFLPFHPGSRLIANMGGCVSNNTSGHLVDTCLGKPCDYVLGLQVVLPNGEIIETGTKGMRRPAGTDLTRYFASGDGLLGVITNIRVRLVPDFKRAYGYAMFKSLRSLASGVQRMYREKRPSPLLMEFMEKEAAKIGYEIKGLPEPTGSAIFFVSVGNTQEEASHKLGEMLTSFRAEQPDEAYEVTDLDVWEKLWGAREVIGSFLMQKTGHQWKSAEVVCNLKDLVEAIEEAANFNKGVPILEDLPLYLYGHIGALGMHPGILIPSDWDNEKQKEALAAIFHREAELNVKYGSCGGEWGQFSKRKEFFLMRYGEAAYAFVKTIKNAVDPNNILNPGILEGYR
ncbi:MAG: FAD-binding oxidoreductase [Deltaproteobacteria bacterium]|nr:FAD-binding oxidoreductase [Deltaproteobacteria bacterium]